MTLPVDPKYCNAACVPLETLAKGGKLNKAAYQLASGILKSLLEAMADEYKTGTKVTFEFAYKGAALVISISDNARGDFPAFKMPASLTQLDASQPPATESARRSARKLAFAIPPEIIPKKRTIRITLPAN